MRFQTRLTASELRDVLHYDPDVGVWRWLKSPRAGWIGKRAGTVTDGSRRINVLGVSYLSSRLAYLYMTGEWPPFEIDHEDRNPSNDKWSNLRPASDTQNQANRPCRKDSKLGVKGVIKVYDGKRVGSKYAARIQRDGKRVNIGYFSSVKEAKAAYDKEAKHLFGEFAHP